MRAMVLDEIVSIEGGKIDAIYRGKRLVTSQRVVIHRNGLVIFVKDWFYDKLHGGNDARESMGDLAQGQGVRTHHGRSSTG